MRNLVFNEQMAAIFGAEIGIALLVLFTVGTIAMHLRARTLTALSLSAITLSRAHSRRLLRVFLRSRLPPSGWMQLCNPNLYYPRLYAGWSWGQALEQTKGMGLSRFATGVFAQLFFNIAMFIPLGVLTAGCLWWGLRASTLAGFGLSLFIELSQLSGNWGLAPCPYRTFDVDDLINNTAGALMGALLVMLWRLLRSRLRARRAARAATANW